MKRFCTPSSANVEDAFKWALEVPKRPCRAWKHRPVTLSFWANAANSHVPFLAQGRGDGDRGLLCAGACAEQPPDDHPQPHGGTTKPRAVAADDAHGCAESAEQDPRG